MSMYLYILYIIGFLFWRIFLVLSWRFQRFHIDPQGMFRITLKISGFSDSYSSLGETRLCSKECSIVKQRFSVILWHFLEHFQLLSAVLHHHFLSVLAIPKRLKQSFFRSSLLFPAYSSRVPCLALAIASLGCCVCLSSMQINFLRYLA